MLAPMYCKAIEFVHNMVHKYINVSTVLFIIPMGINMDSL